MWPGSYCRWTRDRRLLLGGGDRTVRAHRVRVYQLDRSAQDLKRYFTSLMPALAGIEIDRAWHGLFALTADTLPLIGSHRRYPHHLFALGYGGNGMTFGALAARMLVEQWQGIKSRDHDLFRFNRFHS